MRIILRLFGLTALVVMSSIQLKAQDQLADSTVIKERLRVSEETIIRTPSKNALGVNGFLGTGFLNGKMSYYFSNPFYVGLNIEYQTSNLIIQLDDYLGFAKVRETMVFPDNFVWEKDEAAIFFMVGLNLGYSILNTKGFKLVPVGGIGLNSISSSFYPTYEENKYQPFLPYYKIGFFIDLKSFGPFKDNAEIRNKDDNFTSIRLSFGSITPIGRPQYSYYNESNMFYLTVGVAGFFRIFERKQ